MGKFVRILKAIDRFDQRTSGLAFWLVVMVFWLVLAIYVYWKGG